MLNISSVFQNHHKYEETLEIITLVKYCIAEVIINHLKEEHSNNSHYLQLQVISSDIGIILDRVRNGTVYTGVVGMTKAGKSTVLNSLLGKSYLPSSIQPQTAKEVSIIHDLDNPDGVLYGIHENGSHELARGKKDIAQIILSLNSAERYSRSSYDKLVLRAPLVFLEGIKNVRLELSDTPGLNEAGVTFIKASETAVREKVAYIIVLHVNTMKNVGESTLFKNLRHYHPELLSKLDRVLIIVNAYDLTFMDDSSGSIKSKDISKYISDYLKDSKILGETISPEHIIPFSGKWALKAQEWCDNSDLLLKAPKGETSYDAAVNILDYADYDIRELKNGFNLENVNKVCKLLLDFSNITVVKQKLLKMLHENIEEVLLGSVLDDISSKIRDIMDILKRLVIDEHLQEKLTRRDSCKQSLGNFTDVINKRWSNLNELNLPKSLKDELDTSINSLVHSLKSNIDSNIKEKLNYLHNTREHLDRVHVETQIIQTKQQTPKLVVDTIKIEWANIVSVIKNGASSLLASDLNSFIYDISGILDDSEASVEAEPLVSKIKSVREVHTSLIPRITTPSFDINYHKSGISDENMKQMILIGKTQKIRKQEKKICGGRRYIFFGPKDCKHYIEAIPYDVENYSADINSLQAVFTDIAKNWVKIVTEQIDEVILEVSKGISANLNQQLKSTIDLVKEKFTNLLATSEESVKKSENNIGLLQSKIFELELLKKRL